MRWKRYGRARSGFAVVSLLLVLAFLIAPGEQTFAAGAMAVVRASGAQVCDAPAGAGIAELKEGARLDAIGRTSEGEWIEVEGADGVAGWVLRNELVLFAWGSLPVTNEWQPSTTAAATGGAATPGAATPGASTGAAAAGGAAQLQGTVSTSSQRLNVRSAPGTASRVVGRLTAGATIVATGRDAGSGWLQIERLDSENGVGWVSARYVTLDGDIDSLPSTAEAPSAIAAPALSASTTPTGLTGRLVFQTSSGGAIYVYDLASGALRTLTTGADPAVSPDGQSVLFWRDVDAQHNIYRIGIDGGGETLVLSRGEMLRSPKWSPDGSAVVFSRVTGSRSCRDAGYGFCLPDVPPYSYVLPLKTTDSWGLSRVGVDGADLRDVASQPDSMAADWGWGGVLYQSGSGIQLTSAGDGANDNQVVLGEYRYQDPAWQPGADRFVFQSLEKDHWEIFAGTVSSGSATALTRPATTLVDKLPHNVSPAWSPDGQSIVFLSNRSGQWKLWVMDASGANQRQLPIDATIDYQYGSEQVVCWGK